jgi:hypothetical protein
MEIYVTTNLAMVWRMNSKLLQALKQERLILPTETLYCKPIETIQGEYGLRIWPNDSELNKNYRDVILSVMSDEEKSDLRVIERDDEIWFPHVKEDKDKSCNH